MEFDEHFEEVYQEIAPAISKEIKKVKEAYNLDDVDLKRAMNCAIDHLSGFHENCEFLSDEYSMSIVDELQVRTKRVITWAKENYNLDNGDLKLLAGTVIARETENNEVRRKAA